MRCREEAPGRRAGRLVAAIAVGALVAALAGFVGCLRAPAAWAHAGLRTSDPAAGSVFDVAPTAVRLTFFEVPEPSLAVIGVSGAPGSSFATGGPAAVPGDERTLVVPVRLPARGVYTVTWRVVSGVDGHSTAGAFSFGVGVPATEGPAFVSSSTTSSLSPMELAGRWFFALGLIALLGGATASLLGFASTAGSTIPTTLGAGGFVSAVVGLGLLGEAQRRAAAASWDDLLGSSVGRALAWRGVALGVAGVGLLLGRRSSGRSGRGRVAAVVVAVAAAGAFAAHVGAGHAGARGSLRAASVAAQWAHVVAVSVWAGGLAALLVAIRGAPSDARGAAVRRYSRVAAPVLAVVVVTGVVRAVGSVPTWGDLAATGYGRAVVAKLALFGGILGLAATNRRRAVPAAASTLRLLRRLAGGELVLAALALGVAALLASLPPPSALREVEPAGLTVNGSDAAKTLRVRLTTATAVPGPNRFAVRVTDYRSKRTVAARRVSLQFTALDDPSETTTALALEPAPGRTFEGTGTNLSLDGRWGITALVEVGAEALPVPLVVQTRSAPQFLSVQRLPGEPVKYTVELATGRGFLRVWADPERAGPTQVYATYFDDFGETLPMGDAVLTVGSGSSARQAVVRRLGAGQFVADVTLSPGSNEIAVVARTAGGDERRRGSVTLEIPRR
jgi:copper transport protein